MKNFFIVALSVIFTAIFNPAIAQEINDADEIIYSTQVKLVVEIEELEITELYNLLAIEENTGDTIFNQSFIANDEEMDIVSMINCDQFFEFGEDYEVKFFLKQGSTTWDHYGPIDVSIDDPEDYIIQSVHTTVYHELEELQIEIQLQTLWPQELEVSISEIKVTDIASGSVIFEDDDDMEITQNGIITFSEDLDEFSPNTQYRIDIEFEAEDLCIEDEMSSTFTTHFQEVVSNIEDVDINESCTQATLDFEMDEDLEGAVVYVFKDGNPSDAFMVNGDEFTLILPGQGNYQIEIWQYTHYFTEWDLHETYNYLFSSEASGNLNHTLTGNNVEYDVEAGASECNEANVKLVLSRNGTVVSNPVNQNLSEGSSMSDFGLLTNLVAGSYKLELVITENNGNIIEDTEFFTVETNLSIEDINNEEIVVFSENSEIFVSYLPQDGQIIFHDLTGRVITMSSEQINTLDFQGLIIVSVLDAQGTILKKEKLIHRIN